MILLLLGTKERNMEGLENTKEPLENQKDVQIKLEAEPNSTSSPYRNPRPVCTKINAQDAYGLGFWRSWTLWKDKKIIFPTDLISPPNSTWCIGNRQNKSASESVLGAMPPNLGPWPMYRVESIRDSELGFLTTLGGYITVATSQIRGGFCLFREFSCCYFLVHARVD